MAPGEENKGELVEDIGIGDVKVMFEGRNRDIAVELQESALEDRINN